MQHQSQQSSQNDCYSTNQQYFLDICRFGQFDQIKQFLSTLNSESKFDWQWTSNSGDNFVHMLAGNNFPQIFVYLMNELKQRGLKDKILTLINHQNSSGSSPLHYSVIAQSKQMLQKLLQYGCNTNLLNEFNRTALDQAQMISKFELAQILAPVTKPDIQKLKKEFGALEVCNQDDDSESDEDENENENDEENEKQEKQEKEEKEQPTNQSTQQTKQSQQKNN